MVTVSMDAQNQQWLIIDDKAAIIHKIKDPLTARQLCHISKCQETD